MTKREQLTNLQSAAHKAATNFFLFFIIFSVHFASLSAGVPLVRNFDRKTFGGGAQNWAAACDSLGRMYFGNRRGLVVFDSNNWNLRFLPNFSTVRSVLIDSQNERIYVGGSEEFGYFDSSNPFKVPQYVSLTGTVTSPGTRISEIWNIHRLGSEIYFQSDYTILDYNGKEAHAIAAPGKITTSTVASGKLLAAVADHGIYELEGRNLRMLPGSDALGNRRVVAILDGVIPGRLLLVTEFDGLWTLSPSGELTAVMPELSEYLRANQAFCATRHAPSGQIAFGTVSGGVALLRSADDSPIYINNMHGLQDNTVLNLGFDIWANLWLALDNGIDYVASNSAISELPVSSQPLGAGYASLLRGSTLYLATNRGLYAVPYPLSTLRTDRPETLLKGQIWSVDTIGSTLYVGGDGGLWTGSASGGFTKVPEISGTWCVIPVPGHPGRALASTYAGFFILDTTSPRPSVINRVSGFDDNAGRFFFDRNGNLWMAHWMRGIYRMRLTPDLKRFASVDLFDKRNGLPTNNNNVVSVLNGVPHFSTEGGFYRFDPRRNRFTIDTIMSDAFDYQPSMRLYLSPGGALWCVSADNVSVLRAGGSVREDVDTTNFQPLASRIIAGFDHINFISPSTAIFASQDGFFEVATDTRPGTVAPVRLFVNRVVASPDSVVYNAGAKPADDLKVDYDLNSLRFELVMPEYRESNAVQYSFMLEGYDNEWTPWSRTPTKEYTRLNEGTYTLFARALNGQSGQMAETSITFTVAPPWYRSTPAKVFYVLLVIAMGWLAWRAINISSERQARAVARDKERELADLKRSANEETMRKNMEISQLKSEQLEHDIKHKSEELSNITMNVIRKNEILLDIASKLSKLQESLDEGDPAANSRTLAKIQRLIQDNISHDDDWKGFTKNFDIVYENYTRRLTELHPELSPSDLRMCCYLKMGLSSKEIAPLINISYRSVEMTRYRLRKKMGLSREVNLTDYLQKL